MHWSLRRTALFSVALVMAVLATTLSAVPAWAIVAGYVDNFNDGLKNGWRVGQPNLFPRVVQDAGPNGNGDHALQMASGGLEQVPRLIMYNDTQNNDGAWEGNWTAAGITHISMDFRNPSNIPLHMRLGIADFEGVFAGGGGATFATDAIVVPANSGWMNISFPVRADDFIPVSGEEEDLARTLTEVGVLRILHNPQVQVVGEFAEAEFYVDNITAVGPAAVLGDYNGNGVVDAADYVVWRDNPASLNNEGASQGVVDIEDYNFWVARFGATSNDGLGSGGVAVNTSAVVPEPISLHLGLASIAVFVAFGKRPIDRKRPAN